MLLSDLHSVIWVCLPRSLLACQWGGPELCCLALLISFMWPCLRIKLLFKCHFRVLLDLPESPSKSYKCTSQNNHPLSAGTRSRHAIPGHGRARLAGVCAPSAGGKGPMVAPGCQAAPRSSFRSSMAPTVSTAPRA